MPTTPRRKSTWAALLVLLGGCVASKDHAPHAEEPRPWSQPHPPASDIRPVSAEMPADPIQEMLEKLAASETQRHALVLRVQQLEAVLEERDATLQQANREIQAARTDVTATREELQRSRQETSRLRERLQTAEAETLGVLQSVVASLERMMASRRTE